MRSKISLTSACAVVACGAVGLALGLSGSAAAAVVTIQPAGTVTTDNCYPFGLGGDSAQGKWTPYGAYVYKNVPPFHLVAGDTIAFDTSAVNDADIQTDIALAATTSNGSDVPAGTFTKVVSNTQTAASARGNATVGDFDLRYVAESPFDFAGGGLVIRFSNPSAAYAADTSCTSNISGANADDSSGFFVNRHAGDADGVYPWDSSYAFDIPSFQIVYTPLPPAQDTPATSVTPSSVDKTKPTLGGLSFSSTVFEAAKSGASTAKAKVGTKVSFSLSEASSVKFTVLRKTKGRKVGKKCKTATHANRKKKSCTLWKAVRGSFTVAGKAGKNTFTFTGRVAGKSLKPASYRLNGTATDPSANASVPRRKGFKIVK